MSICTTRIAFVSWDLSYSEMQAKQKQASLTLFIFPLKQPDNQLSKGVHVNASRGGGGGGGGWGGSVVECLTRDRRAVGSSIYGVTALWSLSKTHLSYLSTGSTQEDPSLFN